MAIILDRVPPEAVGEIRDHLTAMLKEQGLALAPLFPIPEVPLGADGLLGDAEVGRLKGWLSALANDARARALVVRHTLSGALDSIDSRIAVLAEATGEQQAATNALARVADAAYAEAADGVRKGMLDGTLLRGEVLSRWQEFVGTGEFFKQVESAVSRMRDRITAAVKGQPAPGQQLGEALQSGVAALVTAEGSAPAQTPSIAATTPSSSCAGRGAGAGRVGPRTTCSTSSATRAAIAERRPRSPPMESTVLASSSCSSPSPTPPG